MADMDRRDDSPSLEPPSLGFGFRRKKKQAAEPDPAPEVTDPAEQTEASAGATRPDSAPEPRPDAQTAPAPAPPPVPASAPETEAVPAASMTPPGAPPAAPAARRTEEPPTAVVDTRTVSEPAVQHEPEAAGTTDAESGRGGLRWSELVERIPVFEGRAAAAVTGLVVGLIMVVATAASLRACDIVRGTATCGGGPGFLLLVATLILSIYAGSLLLRHWGEPDPGSTSFLAVGLVAVMALLFFVDVLLSWAMIIVIPLTAVGAFLLSHWVTTTYIEPADQ